MKHATETEWNEYLAGTCKADRAAWIAEHVKDCSACHSRMQESLALRTMLDQWQVDTAGHDIAEKVTQAAQGDAIPFKSTAKRLFQRRFRFYAWRVAATILIGISLGHLAGRNSAKTHIAKQQGTAVETKPSYLAALDLQFASDLTWSVLEDNHSDAENQK